MEQCARCGKELVSNGVSVGYGLTSNGDKICYACCAKEDKEYMVDNDAVALYLTKVRCVPTVTNWPGTLKFKVREMKKTEQYTPNVGMIPRTHVWFDGPNGTKWYGFQVGFDSELCYCKKLKG